MSLLIIYLFIHLLSKEIWGKFLSIGHNTHIHIDTYVIITFSFYNEWVGEKQYWRVLLEDGHRQQVTTNYINFLSVVLILLSPNNTVSEKSLKAQAGSQFIWIKFCAISWQFVNLSQFNFLACKKEKIIIMVFSSKSFKWENPVIKFLAQP